jgi:hypothetical protein
MNAEGSSRWGDHADAHAGVSDDIDDAADAELFNVWLLYILIESHATGEDDVKALKALLKQVGPKWTLIGIVTIVISILMKRGIVTLSCI